MSKPMYVLGSAFSETILEKSPKKRRELLDGICYKKED